MIEVLKELNKQLESIGLNYEFKEMSKSPPTYPYWVGDYTLDEPLNEDGMEQSTILLTGFSRGTAMELEEDKALIKDHFKHDVSVITEAGSAVVFSYGGCFTIPQDEFSIVKCQVNIIIKTWKGN